MASPPFRVLGIPGSLRRASFNRGLLVAAQEVAPPGIEIEITDLSAIPLFNQDVEARGDPPAVAAFKGQIRSADALLIATPEYNYSIPGVLKNAIDWASRPPRESVLNRKPVALLGAGGGSGTIRSQMALRQVFVFTETYVMLKPEIYVASARERFDEAGRLTDERVREQIRQFLPALVSWARTVTASDG